VRSGKAGQGNLVLLFWPEADFAVTSGSVGVADQLVSRKVRGPVSASRSSSQVWLAQAHFYFQFRIQSDTVVVEIFSKHKRV